MQVYLIDPDNKTISVQQVGDDEAGIAQLIGFDSIDFDEIDDNGDRLYFDESCFIRHGAGVGRFKVDNLAPVAGKGVVAGGQPGGKAMKDAIISAEALAARVTFL